MVSQSGNDTAAPGAKGAPSIVAIDGTTNTTVFGDKTIHFYLALTEDYVSLWHSAACMYR